MAAPAVARARAAWVLAGMIAVWAVVFGVLVWQRHDRFGSFGFDMGIFDQAVWLAARGKSFITVRGLDVFGHHANVGFYLLAPFSWLGAGPHFLNLFQVGALAAAPVPLYLLGRHRGLNPWLALVPAGAFLLHPSSGFLAWELFHPETVAIPFFLGAYLAAAKRRFGWYSALLVISVMWKEDVALAAVILGLIVLLRGDRRVGLWTMVGGVVWFIFVNRILLGAVNGAGAFYDTFFGDLGGSPTEILYTALVHPTRILEKLTAPSARTYAWELVAPFGFIPLLSPLAALIGLPQTAGNVLSINSFTREITFHYTALPLAALSLGAVETLARLRDRVLVRRGLAGVLAGASLIGAIQLGVSPIGQRYDDGWWPRTEDPRRDAQRAALAEVPDGVAVSATYAFVPHLSHRDFVYEFPNPYRERNWGVQGEGQHDPEIVEWIIADAQIMGPQDRDVLQRAVLFYGFDIVFNREGVVVARRR